jgi:hypothetical protein
VLPDHFTFTLVELLAEALTPVGVLGAGILEVVALAALDWADTFGGLALSKASTV